MAKSKDWTISIFVPSESSADAGPQPAPDPSVKNHSMQDYFLGKSKIVEVSGKAIQAQWAKTVNHLMELSSSIADHKNGWILNEIEIGLTLSAKGELLFIAEAGAEASITLKLVRKHS